MTVVCIKNCADVSLLMQGVSEWIQCGRPGVRIFEFYGMAIIVESSNFGFHWSLKLMARSRMRKRWLSPMASAASRIRRNHGVGCLSDTGEF